MAIKTEIVLSFGVVKSEEVKATLARLQSQLQQLNQEVAKAGDARKKAELDVANSAKTASQITQQVAKADMKLLDARQKLQTATTNQQKGYYAWLVRQRAQNKKDLENDLRIVRAAASEERQVLQQKTREYQQYAQKQRTMQRDIAKLSSYQGPMQQIIAAGSLAGIVKGAVVGRFVRDMVDAVQQVFRFYTSIIQLAAEFQIKIKESQIAMAAIIQQAYTLTDAQGKMLTGQDAFNAAMNLSAKLQNQMLVEANRSMVTFEEMVEVTKSGGLATLAARGIPLEKQATLLTKIVAAEKAIGVLKSQQFIEVRQLLDGDIRRGQLARQLVATGKIALEDLKKMTGPELAAAIDKALEEFAYAGIKHMQTIQGRLEIISDNFKFALAKVFDSPEVQNSVSQLMQYIQDRLFVTVEVGGEQILTLTSEAQKFVTAIGTIIEKLSDLARWLADKFTLDTIARITLLTTAFVSLSGVITGLVIALSTFAAILAPLGMPLWAMGVAMGSLAAGALLTSTAITERLMPGLTAVSKSITVINGQTITLDNNLGNLAKTFRVKGQRLGELIDQYEKYDKAIRDDKSTQLEATAATNHMADTIKDIAALQIPGAITAWNSHGEAIGANIELLKTLRLEYDKSAEEMARGTFERIKMFQTEKQAVQAALTEMRYKVSPEAIQMYTTMRGEYWRNVRGTASTLGVSETDMGAFLRKMSEQGKGFSQMSLRQLTSRVTAMAKETGFDETESAVSRVARSVQNLYDANGDLVDSNQEIMSSVIALSLAYQDQLEWEEKARMGRIEIDKKERQELEARLSVLSAYEKVAYGQIAGLRAVDPTAVSRAEEAVFATVRSRTGVKMTGDQLAELEQHATAANIERQVNAVKDLRKITEENANEAKKTINDIISKYAEYIAVVKASSLTESEKALAIINYQDLMFKELQATQDRFGNISLEKWTLYVQEVKKVVGEKSPLAQTLDGITKSVTESGGGKAQLQALEYMAKMLEVKTKMAQAKVLMSSTDSGEVFKGKQMQIEAEKQWETLAMDLAAANVDATKEVEDWLNQLGEETVRKLKDVIDKMNKDKEKAKEEWEKWAEDIIKTNEKVVEQFGNDILSINARVIEQTKDTLAEYKEQKEELALLEKTHGISRAEYLEQEYTLDLKILRLMIESTNKYQDRLALTEGAIEQMEQWNATIDAMVLALGVTPLGPMASLMTPAKVSAEQIEKAKASATELKKQIAGAGKEMMELVPVTMTFGEALAGAFDAVASALSRFESSLPKAMGQVFAALSAVEELTKKMKDINFGTTNSPSKATGWGDFFKKTFSSGSNFLRGLPSMLGLGGAVVGVFSGTFGFFKGLFTRAARKIAEEIGKEMTGIMNKYQAGESTLIKTLEQLQAKRQEAIDRLSGKKGGKEELEKLLPEFDKAIADLKSEQKKIFEDFETQLKLLRLPEYLRDIQTSFDGIIKTYKQYKDAGGDVAKANEYLLLSFGDLRKKLEKELSDELKYYNKQLEDEMENWLKGAEDEMGNLISIEQRAMMDIDNLRKEYAKSHYDRMKEIADEEEKLAETIKDKEKQIQDIKNEGIKARRKSTIQDKLDRIAAIEDEITDERNASAERIQQIRDEDAADKERTENEIARINNNLQRQREAHEEAMQMLDEESLARIHELQEELLFLQQLIDAYNALAEAAGSTTLPPIAGGQSGGGGVGNHNPYTNPWHDWMNDVVGWSGQTTGPSQSTYSKAGEGQVNNVKVDVNIGGTNATPAEIEHAVVSALNRVYRRT